MYYYKLTRISYIIQNSLYYLYITKLTILLVIFFSQFTSFVVFKKFQVFVFNISLVIIPFVSKLFVNFMKNEMKLE